MAVPLPLKRYIFFKKHAHSVCPCRIQLPLSAAADCALRPAGDAVRAHPAAPVSASARAATQVKDTLNTMPGGE